MNPQPKPKTEKNLSYKQWIKTKVCLLAHLDECIGPIDSHHVVPVSLGGSDKTCVPLCRKHHDAANNRKRFEEVYAVLLRYEVERLNREYAKLPKRQKKERQLKPVVKVSVKHCPCKREHLLPVSQLMNYNGSDGYMCPKLGWVKVERRTA